ncbi:hypothetical protein QR680_014996 [Steinernema hermaphroditum]|uniref:Peptidase S1 domain-containing protein n=1 Tax=Steinernema hermaphroditum TaxID=289476 RepID=A0AA39IDD8_9BILA|nr:hypothetical protein QR680_014996 [Steinernema hermaphroditum]
MRRLFSIILFGLAHSFSLNLTSTLLKDGHRSEQGHFPYVGYLESGCSGALITPQHVLTHLRCTWDLTEESKIYFGYVNLRVPFDEVPNAQVGTPKHIEIVTVHEEVRLLNAYSLGLITLKEPLLTYEKSNYSTWPIKVMRNDGILLVNPPAPKHPPVIVAYGKRGTGEYRFTDQQNFKKTRFLNPNVCRRQWSDFNAEAVCVGLEFGGDQLMTGDSGATLSVYPYEVDPLYPWPKKPYLIGIGAYTPGSDSGFFVRVSKFCDKLHEMTGGAFSCHDKTENVFP